MWNYFHLRRCCDIFLSTLFCHEREHYANREQGVLERREHVFVHVTSSSLLGPVLSRPWGWEGGGWRGGSGRVEMLFRCWRREGGIRSRWCVVGERGDRSRSSAARPGNTIKLPADLLRLTYNSYISLSVFIKTWLFTTNLLYSNMKINLQPFSVGCLDVHKQTAILFGCSDLLYNV